MAKGLLCYPLALLAALGLLAQRAEAASLNIEENRDSVAPLIERGELAKGKLTRAVFAKQIVKREPVDEVTALSSDTPGIYFFTELKDMAGHTVTHRWEYDGKRIGYTEFKVTAPYWRAWSYRKTPPGSTGMWKVKVLNTVGEVIGEKALAPQAAR